MLITRPVVKIILLIKRFDGIIRGLRLRVISMCDLKSCVRAFVK